MHKLLAALLAVTVITTAAFAQKAAPKPPTNADWAAVAKLPDFTGVWEQTQGGGGGRGRGGAPAGPSLTPEYAAKRNALRASAAEDKETANCLPPGMPGIM